MSLDAQQLNGHDLQNPAWRDQMAQYIRRAKLELLFRENGAFSTTHAANYAGASASYTAPSSTPSLGGAGNGDESDFSLMAAEAAEALDALGNTTYAIDPNKDMVFLTSVEVGTRLSSMVACDIKEKVRDVVKVRPGCKNAQRFCQTLGDKEANVFGVEGQVLPLYEYALMCRAGTQNNHTLFCNMTQRKPLPVTLERLHWLLGLALYKKASRERCMAIATVLYAAIEADGVQHQHEQACASMSRAWMDMVGSARSGRFSSRPREMAYLDDAEESHAPKHNLSEQQRRTVWGDEGRDLAVFYVIFISFPETVRYFGGETYRRLALFWPDSWLMGLRIQPRRDAADTSDLMMLERMLCENPLSFCFDDTRPRIYSHEHMYSAWNVTKGRTGGFVPCLNASQLLSVCRFYRLPLPSKREFFAVVLLGILRESYYRLMHVCVTIRQVFDFVKEWLQKTQAVIAPHKISVSLWEMCKEHKHKAVQPPAGASEEAITDEPLTSKWFEHKVIDRVQRALGDLMALPQYGGSIYCHYTSMTREELVQQLQDTLLCGNAVDQCVVYVREAHRTEGMLLYAVHRICVHVEFMARAHGPVPLRTLPPNVRCCSEQLAGLRKVTGYHPGGAHQVQCEAFTCIEGCAGSGKTAFIELLERVVDDPRKVMVVSFQNSHLNAVTRNEFLGIRAVTLMRLLSRHEMLCGNSCAATAGHKGRSDGMSDAQIKKTLKMREKMIRKMHVDREAWQQRYAGQPQENFEPESHNYGYPFKVCPLEEVEYFVLEEFGTSPWASITLLLAQIIPCCPKLRGIVIMGDRYQLYPISPGHILDAFVQGFGSLEFWHTHRAGEGTLKQLGLAARYRNSDMLAFDNQVASFYECAEQDRIVPMIKDIVRRYNISVHASQIIARTNAWCEKLNTELREIMYPWGASLSAVPRAPKNALDALEKMTYKLNRPALGVCNNGLYLMHFLARVKLEFEEDDEERARQEIERAHEIEEDEMAQAMAANVHQLLGKIVGDANEAATIHEAELVPATAIANAGLEVEELVDMMYGTETQGRDLMASNLPAEFSEAIMPRLMHTKDLRLPAECFGKTPRLPPNCRAKYCLPIPPSAIAIMDAQFRDTLNDTQRPLKYRAVLMDIAPTTYVPPSQSYQQREMHKGTLPVLVCREFRDGMNVSDVYSIDQSKLLYVPYTSGERDLCKRAIAVTNHCMQGNQSGCIFYILPPRGRLPGVSRFDTCNHAYMAFTRAMVHAANDSGVPHHPSLIVIGRMVDLCRVIDEHQEPPRTFQTGRLLQSIRDATRHVLTDMDYTQAALLEEQEAGCFGVRGETFAELLKKQTCKPDTDIVLLRSDSDNTRAMQEATRFLEQNDPEAARNAATAASVALVDLSTISAEIMESERRERQMDQEIAALDSLTMVYKRGRPTIVDSGALQDPELANEEVVVLPSTKRYPTMQAEPMIVQD